MRTKINTALLITLLTWSSVAADDNKMFVGVSSGYSHFNVEQTDKIGAIILGNKIQENAYNIILEGGYHYTPKIDLTLNYQRVILDDVTLNNFYSGVEYKLKIVDKFIPYVGAYLGYSQLHWDKKPINTVNNDYYSGSYMAGVKAGVVYPLTSKVDFKLDYQFSLMSHTTNLESAPAKSELTHNYLNSFNLGLRYSF